jgi:cysteine desulfurase
LTSALEPPLYLDTAATSPPSPRVVQVMAEAQPLAWGNPSSLHGQGLAAAELLERSRLRLAGALGCSAAEVVFTSGGTEAIHLALLGAAAAWPSGRLLTSAVEHPATQAACQQLAARGWQISTLPVDRQGLLLLEPFNNLLQPPTRLVSLIWGQNEVGTLQSIETIGRLCRDAGVLLHVDGVQVLGHRSLTFSALPVDLLSCTAHKLQGPRGIGALIVRDGVTLQPQLGGGAQEGGRRAGTESVLLALGMAEALQAAAERLAAGAGVDPIEAVRDGLLDQLLRLPGVQLTGAEPGSGRLPHHISLLLRDRSGTPLPGRAVVRQLARHGIAASSGSACSSQGTAASAVLMAMGFDPAAAAAGLRLSLGPWHRRHDLAIVPDLLAGAMATVAAG